MKQQSVMEQQQGPCRTRVGLTDASMPLLQSASQQYNHNNGRTDLP